MNRGGDGWLCTDPAVVAGMKGKSEVFSASDELLQCRLDMFGMVQSVSHRPTPYEIERSLLKRYPRAVIRNALRGLIQEGELAYVFLHGRQVLEPSLYRRVQISPHIALAPEGHVADAAGVTVMLRHGAAFGTGQHPSTRLALVLMDEVFHCERDDRTDRFRRVLDIGTGSGVLAIAALLLGAASATATDIDPCARFEARQNAEINGVGERMTIGDIPLERLLPFYDLVLANLRPPTLHAILPECIRLCSSHGFLVCAGMRSEELEDIVCAYASVGFEPWTVRHEDGWGAAAFGIRS